MKYIHSICTLRICGKSKYRNEMFKSKKDIMEELYNINCCQTLTKYIINQAKL